MASENLPSGRLTSLDQFRGYTVLGMFVVNFLADFDATPALLKHHHTYCSFADTIMPQFFFAVGYSLRLTLQRRIAQSTLGQAYGHVLRRCLGLVLLGIVIYHLKKGPSSWSDFGAFLTDQFPLLFLKREFFQTLVHIAFTTLWVLPVIISPAWIRGVFAFLSGILHLGLSIGFYFQWVNVYPPGIDGCPLGFLTWTVPLLAGSLVCDWIAWPSGKSSKLFIMLSAGIVLSVIGYLLSCLCFKGLFGPVEWRWPTTPFVGPSQEEIHAYCIDVTIMSQRAGSLSYLTFASGFSMLVFAFFFWACEMKSWRSKILEVLGMNALAGYVLHDWVDEAIKPMAPHDAPLIYVIAALCLFLAICYVFLRHLYEHKLFLQL